MCFYRYTGAPWRRSPDEGTISLLPEREKRREGRSMPHHLLHGLFDRKEDLDAHLDEILSQHSR